MQRENSIASNRAQLYPQLRSSVSGQSATKVCRGDTFPALEQMPRSESGKRAKILDGHEEHLLRLCQSWLAPLAVEVLFEACCKRDGEALPGLLVDSPTP